MRGTLFVSFLFFAIHFVGSAFAADKEAVAHFYCQGDLIKLEVRDIDGNVEEGEYMINQDNCFAVIDNLIRYKGRISRLTKVAFCNEAQEMHILYLTPAPTITEGPIVLYPTQQMCLRYSNEINKIP